MTLPRIGWYPRARVEGSGRGVVSQAGAVLLVETVRKTGLDTRFSWEPLGSGTSSVGWGVVCGRA
jgi:hypothetical protein